jgi:hypothetical protein
VRLVRSFYWLNLILRCKEGGGVGTKSCVNESKQGCEGIHPCRVAGTQSAAIRASYAARIA